MPGVGTGRLGPSSPAKPLPWPRGRGRSFAGRRVGPVRHEQPAGVNEGRGSESLDELGRPSLADENGVEIEQAVRGDRLACRVAGGAVFEQPAAVGREVQIEPYRGCPDAEC